MKQFILFFFLTITTSLSAQYTLTGVVHTASDVALGADISLYKMGSDAFYGTVTEADGRFTIDRIEDGDYRLVINYLGFKKHRKRLTIASDTNLGDINLEEDIIEIDGVEITGSMIQAIQKGDTTVFNAGAFKTLPDADAKDLIAKIPGIEIDGGTVTANGEDVQKVTVDGREFLVMILM